MDRKELRNKLYGVVAQSYQDGVNIAMRNYAPSAIAASTPEQIRRWGIVSHAVEQLNDAFDTIEDTDTPLRDALRNLATRSVELRHIAAVLDPDRSRHAMVVERLCCAATMLKEVANIQRNKLAAEGPAR